MLRKYILFTLAIVFVFSACTEKTLDPVLTIGNGPVITAPAGGTTFVLEEGQDDELFADFAWSAADFGFQSGASYSVEVDVAADNFADPKVLGTVNALELKGITVAEINNIMLSKGLPDGAATTMSFRIAATISSEVQTLYSEPLSVDISPFKAFVEYPKLQVPGSYQGWAPENEATAIFSREEDGTYEGFLYIGEDDAKFKITDGPSWDTNWGDDGEDGTLDPGGADIGLATAGYYRLNVNLNDLTYTTAATNWGLIGSATPGGWDEDTDMVVDTDSGTITLTVDLIEGAIKFRANDAWDINFGDTNANGSLEYSGDDILITEAGNYTVELIINVQDYTYKVTKN
ncbi:MAG: SusE domain-containing protein [Bacteroidota bacterium]